MHSLIEIIGGIWELLLLIIKSGFRIRGKYWHWRRVTAAGDEKMKKSTLIRNAVNYGKWVYRMKRLKRYD